MDGLHVLDVISATTDRPFVNFLGEDRAFSLPIFEFGKKLCIVIRTIEASKRSWLSLENA